MVDAVAQFLVDEGFLLTALELYQECIEEGKNNSAINTPAVLKKLFEAAPTQDSAAALYNARMCTTHHHQLRDDIYVHP